MAYAYRLDPKANPKQCELRMERADIRVPAVYELQQDTLRLAFPMESNNDTPYPKNLEPGEDRLTYVFRREAKGAQPANAVASKSVPEADRKAFNELRVDLASAIGLLEAMKYREFLEAYLAPSDRQRAEQRQEFEPMVEHMKQMGPGLLKLLSILRTEVPTFDPSKTRATFDLRNIHVEGLPGLPDMQFIKIGEKWHVEERR